MFVQTLQPESAVERLNKSVIRRFARPRKIQLHLVPISPAIQVSRYKLRTIVYLDGFGPVMLLYQPFQNLDNIDASDTLPHLDSQALTGMIVH